ncbi:hypothetical protein FKM82_020702 [Ascaphus truei]
MDNFPLKTNNDSVSYWFVPVDITYPTPPYMSLRELVERNETLPVKERKFMDMMERYDSNDIYYTSMKYEPGVYKKTGFALNSTIRDTLHRWFVLTNGNLFAKALLIPNERNKGQLYCLHFICNMVKFTKLCITTDQIIILLTFLVAVLVLKR